MQTLESERGLALACAYAEGRGEHRIDIRVVKDERGAGEIGVHVELEASRKSSAQARPQAADGELVDERARVIVERESPIGVKEQAELESKVAVGRLNEEAVLPPCYHGR